ncbi:MAG: hypothetical protein OH338_05175 [Candidatus Parvarchaeota archaeon]|nr:hypothetical protein [Candidatus Parvarchaeota archaeon]MCW1294534.1 hypothetical protein [Candidatus Parvarchaeum tengchongense]MCW1295806.1 hypothetical protein [Candidatus Parvarchaeum tengchongense]MCW1312790.1 hypothetical protein [Candidatus Parvarchaeum tengchongense]
MDSNEAGYFRSSLSKLIIDSNFKGSSSSDLENKVLNAVSDFELMIGQNKFEKLANIYKENSEFFNHAFSSYLYSVTKEMNKYKKHDGDEDRYKLLLSQASLKMLERELSHKGYESNLPIKSLDYSKKHGKRYLYKTALNSLENEGFVQKVRIAPYMALLSLDILGFIPLIKEGLRTPSIYAAELVGITDIFLAISGGLLAYLMGYEKGKRRK